MNVSYRRQLLLWLALLMLSVLLAGLYLLAGAVQHSEALIRYYPLLLTLNLGGILGLCGFMAYGAWRLVQQVRTGAPGARLTLRLLAGFGALALAPLVVVYYFSTQFLNRGIDSWFNVHIEQSLENASLLGRSTLEAVRQDLIGQAIAAAGLLTEGQPYIEGIEPLDTLDNLGLEEDAYTPTVWVQLLDEVRERGAYEEMTIYTLDGQIIASSGSPDDPLAAAAHPPDVQAIAAAQQGEYHANLENLGEEGLQLRVAVPLPVRGVNPAPYILQVIKPLPLRYSTLGDSIQTAANEYRRLVYLRDPLKFSFILTLTIIALMTVLIASVLAFLLARRLASPLRELYIGTRAVARGDYQTRLPVRGVDDLGTLVQSFNEMTSRVEQARRAVEQSHRASEMQHVHLQTLLEHLSSGVLVLDRSLVIHTHNTAANTILHLDFKPFHGQPLQVVIGHDPRLEPLVAVTKRTVQHPGTSQGEVTLAGKRGRQLLLCRCTRLPPESILAHGYVLVFDEITELVKTQRDAAWGEVARRLAHEIKNPLTPIRLSAERIQQKFLERLDEPERGAMRRAIRTIVQQVDSMKQMVDEFSGYAEPMHMQVEAADLNHLIRDVMALHESPHSKVRIVLDLDPELEWARINPGRLRQVLNNLVHNARNALADTAGPATTVQTRNVDHGGARYAGIVVYDNGPGFPEELLDRLFEPYVTTRRKGGLGLAIVKRIVEEHDGIIHASNRPEGGAMLRILLPIAEKKPQSKDRQHARSRYEQPQKSCAG